MILTSLLHLRFCSHYLHKQECCLAGQKLVCLHVRERRGVCSIAALCQLGSRVGLLQGGLYLLREVSNLLSCAGSPCLHGSNSLGSLRMRLLGRS